MVLPERVNYLKEIITARATKDRVVCTDELIDLSNLYRENNFAAAADSCLGVVVMILNHEKGTPRSRALDDRIGSGSMAMIQFYRIEVASVSKNLKSYLSTYEQDLAEGKYVDALASLKSAILCIFGNPLIKDEMQQADIASKIERFKPFLSDDDRTALARIETIFNERMHDLSELDATDLATKVYTPRR